VPREQTLLKFLSNLSFKANYLYCRQVWKQYLEVLNLFLPQKTRVLKSISMSVRHIYFFTGLIKKLKNDLARNAKTVVARDGDSVHLRCHENNIIIEELQAAAPLITFKWTFNGFAYNASHFLTLDMGKFHHYVTLKSAITLLSS